ncbi:MAG: hypothetical protein QW815_00015 [Nitrososphaerota archaeon]
MKKEETFVVGPVEVNIVCSCNEIESQNKPHFLIKVSRVETSQKGEKRTLVNWIFRNEQQLHLTISASLVEAETPITPLPKNFLETVKSGLEDELHYLFFHPSGERAYKGEIKSEEELEGLMDDLVSEAGKFVVRSIIETLDLDGATEGKSIPSVSSQLHKLRIDLDLTLICVEGEDSPRGSLLVEGDYVSIIQEKGKENYEGDTEDIYHKWIALLTLMKPVDKIWEEFRNELIKLLSEYQKKGYYISLYLGEEKR